MNFKSSLVLIVVTIFTFSFLSTSCKKDLQDEKDVINDESIVSYLGSKGYTLENGIYLYISDSVYNYQIAKGDTVTFNYIGYTLNDSIFDTNIKNVAKEHNLDTNVRSFSPVKVIAGTGKLIDGLDKGLLLLKDSIKASIYFPSSMGFEDNYIGPIEHWSALGFDIQVLSVNGKGIQKERNYINTLDLSSYTRSSSGLYCNYIIDGSGSIPTVKDTIYGWYKGSLPDGAVFEEKSNQMIVLSSKELIEGLRLGFLQTKSGGKTDLIVPSYLGYGNKGNETIPEYQTLFYQIGIDSIK
jgi:FKBP-type peptidyl-prolyl cis-trans isomerase